MRYATVIIVFGAVAAGADFGRLDQGVGSFSSVDEALPDSARAALGEALHNEPCRENLRAMGTVLAGGQPLDA